MIPEKILARWKQKEAPWRSLQMVEQDLILSRILVEIYKQPIIAENLAFRGGTALNKLYINQPARFSEDIDLVQIKSEPIGATLDQLRAVIDPWLGKPKWKVTQRSVKIYYTYPSIDNEEVKLKIEINTTEHFHLKDLQKKNFSVNSEWFSGDADILTYQLEEMMATKFKALYQRRKGRDLFDSWMMLNRELIDLSQAIQLLEEYCERVDEKITRALFERNLILKREHQEFNMDMEPLLAIGTKWDFDKAFEMIMTQLMPKLKGDPWKGEGHE
ncbi:MAG: nucleotidyl transferase AbiEii/AbiGii toxin family protein [Candidatus Caenarcaniphilales bacterium]|jgi:predicted nucleotidyltransferase component of viral defense system|nr:nucleotidyl transferase AbiEii/AbiGii toxin family protein [Candidatus Caenarcaniphilales bacterium]